MEQALLPTKSSGLPPALVWRYICFGLLSGFVIGYWFQIAKAGLLAAILSAVWLVYKKIGSQAVNLAIIGCLLALLRGNGLIPAPPAGYFLGEQEFKAQVVELPRLGERITRYVVKPLDKEGIYKLQLITTPWPAFTFGDQISVKCEIKAVDFKAYTNRGIWRECAFPEIAPIGTSKNSLRRWLYQVRTAAGNKVKSLVAEPYATLTTGMLWGDDSGLPSELIASFRRTGTSHLLAVSGYNVMVLTQVLFWVLVAIGLWRRQASLAVLVLMVMFVIFSGAEPSVVRAGAMGSVLLIGHLLARKPDKINLLSGTGAVMLLISPRLVIELGWQLSFAAMAGLTFLSPLLRQKLTWLPNMAGIRQAGSETLAATLVTTPIILWRLDNFSVVAPLANLLVAPMVMLVYWFGLALLILGWFGQIVARPVIWFLSAALFYMTTVINWLASLPWAAASASFVTWLGVIIFYAVVWGWLKYKVTQTKTNVSKI
jgi:ComEC/Rec2-related protein